MQNTTTTPSETATVCSTQNSCITVISLALALGMMTICFCCAVCIRLLGSEYPQQMSAFIAPDPVVVVVQQNKAVLTSNHKPPTLDEDPS
jgi:hypothetical protein